MFIDKLLLAMDEFFQTPTLAIILLIYLLIVTVSDVKWLKIHNKTTLGFLILRVILIPWYPITLEQVGGAVFAFLVLFIPALITLHKMAGDIKLVTVIGLYIGFYPMVLFIAISVVLGMIYASIIILKTKRQVVPFAPAFLLAYLSLFLIVLV